MESKKPGAGKSQCMRSAGVDVTGQNEDKKVVESFEKLLLYGSGADKETAEAVINQTDGTLSKLFRVNSEQLQEVHFICSESSSEAQANKGYHIRIEERLKNIKENIESLVGLLKEAGIECAPAKDGDFFSRGGSVIEDKNAYQKIADNSLEVDVVLSMGDILRQIGLLLRC